MSIGQQPTAEPALDLLDLLPGRWQGDGAGHYPTIEPFAYVEQLTFTRLGDKPILEYVQRTWRRDTGEPSHRENGFVRLESPVVELVLTQPTGYAEIHHGRRDGATIAFGVTAFDRTATARAVETVRRHWTVLPDRLEIDLWMTWAGVVDGHHLHAELRRTSAD